MEYCSQCEAQITSADYEAGNCTQCGKELIMIEKIAGELEVDHNRGVIYFHDKHTGATVLRICRLPAPIPKVLPEKDQFVPTPLDITWGHGVNWQVAPVTNGIEDFHLLGKMSWNDRSIRELVPARMYELSVKLLNKARNAKSKNDSVNMIYWDAEAAGIRALASSLTRNDDDQVLHYIFTGLAKETKDLLWETCLS